MSASTAEEEAAVLDRFLTRLALTEEDKLEKVLSKLLPVAIRNLASPHENTKTKVSCAPIRFSGRVADCSTEWGYF
jgi:proteasome component ECM29